MGLTQPSRSSAPSGHVRSCHAPLGEGSSHLASLFDALPADLSPVDRAAAGDFIHKYAHMFSKSEFDLGRTSLIPHKIDTGQSRPLKQPLRRHPRVQEQYIDEQVELMLQHDIIEPTHGEWDSNVVLAKKSDGSLSSSSSRNEYYLGDTIALLLQDHRTMSTTGSL